MHMVLRLGELCLKHSFDDANFRAQYLLSGLLLMEYANTNGEEYSPKQQALVAKAHSEYWFRQGVAAEEHNLLRARELFEGAVAHIENIADAKIWLEYVRVLQYLKIHDKAATIINQILSQFDGDPEYPSYLFYAGGIFKAQGRHDEAANFFFEATQMGPPRLFSQLEMMFIISRNIEASSRDKDEPSDDAYGMVRYSSLHIVQHG